MKIVLEFPDVTRDPEGKPSYCPFCGGVRLARHGALRRPLADTSVSSVSVQRYRCFGCGRTFRQYPEGVTRAKISNRAVVLVALLRSLGLSCISTQRVIAAVGIWTSQATVWRTVAKAGIRTPVPGRRILARVLEEGEAPGDPEGGTLVRFVQGHRTGGRTRVEVFIRREVPLPEELERFAKISGATLACSDW